VEELVGDGLARRQDIATSCGTNIAVAGLGANCLGSLHVLTRAILAPSAPNISPHRASRGAGIRNRCVEALARISGSVDVDELPQREESKVPRLQADTAYRRRRGGVWCPPLFLRYSHSVHICINLVTKHPSHRLKSTIVRYLQPPTNVLDQT